MPRTNDSPTPKKRYHGGRWRIYWKWNFKQYSLPTQYFDLNKTLKVDSDLRLVSAALATDPPVFPDPYKDSPVARDYIRDRLNSTYDPPPGEWLNEYAREMTGECSKPWVLSNITMLKSLVAEMGPLNAMTPEKISLHLAGIVAKNSIATRNRTRNAFSRFFTWAKRTKRIYDNPVAGIPTLPEPRITDIVYCTPAERDDCIMLAHRTGMREWLAVPIAFYSGMRREEIAKLRWEDIRLIEGSITVVESKTLASRTFPLNSTLEEFLRLLPKQKRSGYVVPSDYEDRVSGLVELERHMKRIVTAIFKQRFPAPRKPRKGCKDFDKKFAEYKQRLGIWENPLLPILERIGWNAWRHTFGSLLAQGGVSIDKISAWMGNTPEVCRRHYTQFIPRDRRDDEIDKL